MKPKRNGKMPSRRTGPGGNGSRRGASNDPGFTATQASSSAENRDSGLKQAGRSDVGGAGPRKKKERDH